MKLSIPVVMLFLITIQTSKISLLGDFKDMMDTPYTTTIVMPDQKEEGKLEEFEECDLDLECTCGSEIFNCLDNTLTP